MSVPNLLWTSDELVPVPGNLMEQIVDKLNMMRACKRVVTNGGSAGIDGMKTDRLPAWLQRNIEKLQNSLLEGSYRPQPVRAVEIEKPGGGKRILGIPTVVDRLIQQAIHQVFNPYFDPEFSPFSFGFRKGRSTTDAALLVQKYQQEGKKWVIDVDLSKFFDEVNHDVLMSLIKRKVKDVRLLKLIDKYLRTGIMQGGVASPRSKGTPQGSPFTPSTHLQTLSLYSELLLSEVNFKFVNFTKSSIFVINGKITKFGISKTDQPGLCFIEQGQTSTRGSRVLNEKVWSIQNTGVSLCSAGQGAHRKDDNTGKFSSIYREITLQPNQTGKGICRNSWSNHQQFDKASAGGIFSEGGQWQKRSNNLRYPLSTIDYGSKSSHRHTISLSQQIKLLPTRKISLKLN
jgi:hypothetical protein